MKLKGQVAIVTGGTSGIGAAIARRFAEEGAAIGIITLCNQGEMDATLTQLRNLGVRAAGRHADISQAGDVKDAVESLAEEIGPAAILINNAAIWQPNPVPESSIELFDRHVDINLKGTFYVTQYALPAMLAAGKGHIVNIGSVSGIAGRAGDSAYSASKAGVAMLTRTLARELGSKGIRINCICPGAVATPLTAPLRTPEGERAIEALMEKHSSPNHRFFIQPEDIAGVALFLVSDASLAIHGAVITVDEGLTATM